MKSKPGPATNLNRFTFVLAAGGIYVAGALTAAHYLGQNLPCGASSGCEIVANDPSAYLLGQPIALFGLAGYLLLLCFAALRMAGVRPKLLTIAGLAVSAPGAAVSLWLTRHSVKDLGVTCAWCLSSATLMCFLLAAHLIMVGRDFTGIKWSKVDLGICVLALIALAGGSFYTLKKLATPAVVKIDVVAANKIPVDDLVPAGIPIRGNPDARVTIVEFGDMACPGCKFWSVVLAGLVQRHSNLRVVFRHYPLTMIGGHEHSFIAAALSEDAAAKGRFWDFVDSVYSAKGHLDQPTIEQAAKLVGISLTPSPSATALVNRDVALVNRLKIGQTPTFIILLPDGKRIVATNIDMQHVIAENQVARWWLVN